MNWLKWPIAVVALLLLPYSALASLDLLKTIVSEPRPVLPLLIGLRLMITFVMAPLLAVLSVFIRDIGQALPLIMTALFFTTPIIYPL